MPAAGPAIRPSPTLITAAAAAAARKAAVGKKAAPTVTREVEERSLNTYDRVFGVIDGGLSTGEGVA
ncbi:hypothetical protein ACWEWG_00275 [Streptomyces sp. NPDC003758]|uniref:Uncharacterized protein n=1 Tax=Streptomyces cynarae TaxID=2981134 RepID=A0ABY6EEM0_9ACTN|nr:hypothetical protein [Streptomyces cynarae]UXY24828.1 hypothetical protein N8I84_02040 [Streptomyces cynarae]